MTMFVRKRDAAIRAEVALSQPVTVGVRVPEGVLNISKLRPREHGHRVACRDDQLVNSTRKRNVNVLSALRSYFAV